MSAAAMASDTAHPVAAALGSAAVLIIPAGILMAPDLAEWLFYLLALFGAAHLARRPGSSQHDPSLGLLTALGAGFFSIALLSLLTSESALSGFERLDRYAHFLVAPLVAVQLRRSNISTPFLLLALKLAALLVGVVALIQFMSGVARPGAAVNPLLFGGLSLLLAFFSLVRLPLETPRQRALSLLAFCAGTLACLLSQARGVWIEAVLLMAIVVFFWWRARLLSGALLLGSCAGFLALVAVSCTTTLVQNRVGEALAEYHAFREQAQWNSSVAIRLIMWEGALRATQQRPLLGWGFHRTVQSCAAMLDEPAQRRMLLGYNHLHNEYLTTLVGRGAAGLLSLLLLLLLPVVVYLRRARCRTLLAHNSIGTLLCAAYTVSGLTNLAFGHDVMNIFFITLLALTLGCTRPATLNTGVRFRSCEAHRYTSHALDFRPKHDTTDRSPTAGLPISNARYLVAHQPPRRR